MPACGDCGGTVIEYSSTAGNGFCVNCGTVVEENTIVNEVTFGETSSGAAMVQGSYVGQGSTRARMTGPFGNRGSMESREQTMMNANKKIRQISSILHLPDHFSMKAGRYYELAVETKFTKGRKSIYVVASCLYCVCREKKNSIMLIDFSDLIQVNVFELGHTYLQLVQALSLRLPLVDPSHYISRFASLLEYGEETQRVALDATRLCSRFSRDWLLEGRRPSGICGAALFIASRMNHFRRSISEIVQVVKIADVTVRKRLKEFENTQSADLSIDKFRNVWIEEEGMPPAFEAGREKEEKEKIKMLQSMEPELETRNNGRKRRRIVTSDDENANVEEVELEVHTKDPVPGPSHQSMTHIDPNLLNIGILVDTTSDANQQGNQPSLFLPDDDASDEDQDRRSLTNKALRSRDLEQAASALPPVSDFEQSIDVALATEVQSFLETEEASTLTDVDNGVSKVQSLAEELQKPSLEQPEVPASGDLPEGDTWWADVGEDEPRREDIEESDPLSGLNEEELDRFILSEEEVKIKERIWMELNKEYLVAIARRGEQAQTQSKPRKRRKGSAKPRDSSTPAGSTAGESVRNLVKKTSKFSKRINYDVIEGILGGSVTKNAGTLEAEYQFDEKGENVDDTSMYATDAEMIVEEDGGGEGVGTRGKPSSRAATSEAGRTDDEADDEGQGNDEMSIALGNFRGDEYAYDEAYEQEVD